MAQRSCDGAGLLAAFRAAVAGLEAHVDEVNALNVFPVPDGDTGSNMLATVRAALDEAERVADPGADRVAAAASRGALLGARGNSGVIASQILRGLSEALGGKRRFNGLDLAHALREGSRTAYGAVAKPVEGTILTVIREAADAAVEQAERTNDVEAVLTATVDAAEASVARTPTLLAILREAGVVDSGGQGLYRLLQGALLGLIDRTATTPSRGRRGAVRPATLVAHADEGFGYETMFLVHARPGVPLDVDAIRRHLESIGESVLVAGDAHALKVHVHNDRPDRVIGYGLEVGGLSRITVENLDEQTRDVRESRATAFAGPTSTVGPTPPPGSTASVGASAGAAAEASPRVATGSASEVGRGDGLDGTGPRLPLGVVAVAAGDGLHELFEQFRVPDQLAIAVVPGGQSSNPSTGELLAAIERLPADEVVVLPNNPNVVLAARQVAAMADRRTEVVPTRNAAEGVAALLALDPTADAAANVAPMTDAGRAIQTLQVTEAVRDARIGEAKVRRGQTIVLDPDDGLVAVNGDRVRAVTTAVAALRPGYELVTVYYGDGADLDEAETMARAIGAICGGADVQLVRGGQPYYRYLIAAE